MKFWIDTDIGGDIDDALALLLAMSYDDIEIVGVSTVFENTVARAKIAKKLLEMGNKPHVKVYAGIGQPFKATTVHNHRVDLVSYPKTYIPSLFDDVQIEDLGAIEALKQALEENDDLVVITLGALTNIAYLINSHPETAAKIKKLYIMGTAIWLNLNEFNISCDPEAADIVLNAPIPKAVISLDVTFKCQLNNEQIETLKQCDSELVKTVIAMNELWGEGMILHDPLTLSEAINENFVTYEPGNLKVELEGSYSRGKVINLMDFNWGRKPNPFLHISTAVKNEQFTEFFVKKIYYLNKRLLDDNI